MALARYARRVDADESDARAITTGERAGARRWSNFAAGLDVDASARPSPIRHRYDRRTPLPSGGTGLSASPPGTLGTNTIGYCDFVDENGRTLRGGTAPPSTTAFVRRWSIAPGPPAAIDTLAIQIAVIPIGSRRGEGSTLRGPDEVRLLGIRTRK